MIEVKPFKAEDMLYVIDNGVLELGLRMTPNDEIKKLAQDREDSGLCVTGWVDGVVVGVAGIEKMWDGVGEIWLLLTPYITTHTKDGYKCIRQGMKKLIEESGLRLILSHGRMDFPQCHILFKHLKFKVKGMIEGYTSDGCDCIIYAKGI